MTINGRRKNDEAVMYVNCETSFGSLRIVKGVNHLIYSSNTNTEKGH